MLASRAKKRHLRRTVVVVSTRIPRKVFNIFVELEGMYRNIVEQSTMFAVGNDIRSFVMLKAIRYRDARDLYPHLPSHYAYTACQDAATRSKSFLRLRDEGRARKRYPEVKKVSIWLDDHLWKPNGLTSIKISTHRGWIDVDLEPNKHYWRYINRGWRLASEARVKLNRRSRKLTIYLTFVKEAPRRYEPKGLIPVDLNENNVTILIDAIAYLFETDTSKVVIGYSRRRKRIQEKYDRIYGANSREKRKAMGKLKEWAVKKDIRLKIANIIARTAHEKCYGIVLERFGKNVAENMIARIDDEELRHRIYQAAFRGMQRAIIEKAREYDVPVILVNPKGSSTECPFHKAPIEYENGSRIGRCTKGGELWHRDVAGCWNHLFRACAGDGSIAPSPCTSILRSPVPLGSPATHEPTEIKKSLWAGWKSLPQHNETDLNKTKR